MQTTSTNESSSAPSLLRMINTGRARLELPQLGPLDPSIPKPRFVQLDRALRALGDDPVFFDPEHHPGVFERHVKEPPMFTPILMRYYIRVYAATRETMIAFKNRYKKESDWVDRVLAKFDEKAIPQEGTMNMLYVGKTSCSIWGRIAHDLQPCNTSSRARNFTIFTGRHSWRIYEWKELALSFDDLIAAREDPVYDNTECNLVALCGPLALNSSPGGERLYWEMNENFKIALNDSLLKIEFTALDTLKKVDERTTKNMQAAVGNHLFTMHDFYIAEREKNPYEPFVTVDLLGLAGIMSAAEVKRTVDGHMLSVLLTKHITTEGILKGISYESSEAGKAATSHKHMFELARDIVEKALSSKLTVEQRADLLSLDIPRMDVWAMSTKTSMGVAAVMFTSRYLRITKPYIILTHSMAVLALFYRDLFKLSFLNENAADEFMNYKNTNNIEKYWRKDRDETKFFNANIKKDIPLAFPTVGCYGPGKDDWAIVIPDYDPGYAFRSPKVRPSYNRVMLISRVVYFITVSALEGHLPKKTHEPIKEFLLRVIRDVMKVISQKGIMTLLNKAKAEMKEVHATHAQHLHAASLGLNRSEMQQSIADTQMKAIGHPESQERAEQWNELIESRTIPCPNAMAYGAGAHRVWFLTRAKACNLVQATIQYKGR